MNRIATSTGIIYNSTCCLSAIHPKQVSSFSERQFLFYKGCKAMGDNGKRAKPFWDNVKIGTPEECWEWQGGKNSDGYGIYHNGGKSYRAHRKAYESKFGPIPEDMDLLHSCDNPPCCNWNHHSIGTAKENIGDCITKNRNAKGVKNGNAKLDDERVIEILRLSRTGEYTQRQIASFIGVSPQIISDVVCRKIWKHVLIPE